MRRAEKENPAEDGGASIVVKGGRKACGGNEDKKTFHIKWYALFSRRASASYKKATSTHRVPR